MREGGSGVKILLAAMLIGVAIYAYIREVWNAG